MKKYIYYVGVMIFMLIYSGCSKTYTIEIHPKKENSNSTKKVALFLDGTANDFGSRTNVSKLYGIAANQNKDNLHLFYNEGVGTGGRGIGAAIGWGIGKDVREAYMFLTEHYTAGSKLYLFGFSRGAYTARILAGMIHTVGIYNLDKFTNAQDRKDIIAELFTYAYKNQGTSKEVIRAKGQMIMDTWRNLRGINVYVNPLEKNTQIEIMGLWDTVEALGAVPTGEALADNFDFKKDPQNIIYPNNRYVDQICNIKKILHAVDLDDNRAFVFTPNIMTNKRVKENCECPSKINIKTRVNEVWFSGAHADVGGGYKKNNSISGVSLNWMIKEINTLEKEDSLLPKNAKVYEDVLGYVHNAEESIIFAYRDDIRDDILEKYLGQSEYKKIRIHASVVERLESGKCRKEYDSKWYESKMFSKCITVKDGKIKFNQDGTACQKIMEVVK